MPNKGRFVIFVKSGPEDAGHPRNYDAYHKTREAAKREAARSSPPKGCEYVIVELPRSNKDPLGVRKKQPRGLGL
jgi:hypothetical protein